MRRVRAWWRRLCGLVRRRDLERELDLELRLHLELETRENLRRGMDPASARTAARVAFGGVDRFTEQVRDARGVGWLDDLVRDVRHAVRSFRRAPGFTVAAVLTLALGAGATTAVFSVVHAVLLAPLPYAEPDRLVRLWETNPSRGAEAGAFSPGTFADLRERARSLEDIALHFDRDFLFAFDDEVVEVHGAAVTASFFPTLGVEPMVGRAFDPDGGQDPGGVVVIGYGVWQRWFGGSPDVIGSTFRDLNYSSVKVIGVMPPGFDFPNGSEVWFPSFSMASVTPAQRQWRYYDALGRLRAGSSLDEARAETAAIAADLAVEHPASNAGWGVHIAPLDDSIIGGTRPALLVLLGLVGCLLLIACANVANLMIARATARRHEVAVRLALGAGGGRLVRQWLGEGMVLAVLGGIAGLALARMAIGTLVALAPGGIPRLDEVSLSGPVLLFGLGVTCATAIATGLAPVMLASAAGALEALRGGARGTDAGSARVRQLLVGGQVALTLVLLTASVLLLRSFVQLRAVDLGFARDNVMAVEYNLALRPFTWFGRTTYYDRLLGDVGALPGIESVAGVSRLPLTPDVFDGSLWRTDAPGAASGRPPASAADQWRAMIPVVTADYFATMGIPILRGRGFLDSDRFTQAQLDDRDVPRPAGVAVVNEAFVRQYFPDADPLGVSLTLFDDVTFAAQRIIVGVVGDVRLRAVTEQAPPAVYLPFAQHPGNAMSLVLRTRLPVAHVQSAVEARLRDYPEISLPEVRTLASVVSGAIARPRFNLILVATFGVVALALAGVGIAGIVGYLVARRTRELGVRVALGARPLQIAGLVLAEAARPLAAGIVAGTLGSIAVARMIRGLLFGVQPIDATSFIAAVALLAATALLAALAPAARAARVDPQAALRT